MSTQQPQQQVIYQQVIKSPSNGLAITSLVLGIIAIVIGVWSFIPILGLGAAFISFLPALIAVILGHMGLKRSTEIGAGQGQAKTGMILGYITLGIIILTTVFWIFAMAAGSASSSVS